MQSKEILASVAEQISTAGVNGVVSQVVKKLADAEITRRADAMYMAVKLVEEITRALKKIKPDQQAFDGNGKIVTETYSKAKTEERKKLEDRLNKVETAIAKATDSASPDYGPLFEVAKNPVLKTDDKSDASGASQPAGGSAE